MISEELRNVLVNTLNKSYKEFGIRRDIKQLAKLDYEDFLKATQVDLNSIASKARNEKELMETINFMETLTISEQNYYILENSIKMIVDLDKIDKSWKPNDAFFKNLDNSVVEDFTIDFIGKKDITFCVKCVKMESEIQEDDNSYSRRSISISMLKKDGMIHTVDYQIISGKYPRVYIADIDYSRLCKGCTICREVTFTEKCETTIRDIRVHDNTYYQVPKNLRRLGSNCKIQNGYNLQYDIDDIIYATLYAINKFISRKTIVKNSDKYNKKLDEQVRVAVPVKSESNKNNNNKNSNVRYVTLKDHVVYEKKTGYKPHTHHKSPCEHYRRETVRKLKSGKTVPVKGSVVNKGKGNNVVYKVDK